LTSILNADNEDNFERSKNITELVSSDSVVAVKAEDDNIEYYMLKVTSGNSFEYIFCTFSVNKRSRARSRVTRCKVKTGIVNKYANSRNMNDSLIESC
jgi:hypothetical protein